MYGTENEPFCCVHHIFHVSAWSAFSIWIAASTTLNDGLRGTSTDKPCLNLTMMAQDGVNKRVPKERLRSVERILIQIVGRRFDASR